MASNIQLAGYSVKVGPFPSGCGLLLHVQTSSNAEQWEELQTQPELSKNDSESSWASGTRCKLCPDGVNVHAQVTHDTGMWSMSWGNGGKCHEGCILSLLHQMQYLLNDSKIYFLDTSHCPLYYPTGNKQWLSHTSPLPCASRSI